MRFLALTTSIRALACAAALLFVPPSLVLAQVPPPGPPPPPTGQPPPPPPPPAQGYGYGYGYGYGQPYDPYRMQNAYFQYENEKKNEGIALLLEFFIPGVGSIYAEHLNGALLTWACTIGGMVLLFWGFSQVLDASIEERNDDDVGGTAIIGGIVLVVGGRIYGLYDSYASTKEYNLQLRRRLGLEVGFAITPLRAPGGDLVWGPSLQLRF